MKASEQISEFLKQDPTENKLTKKQARLIDKLVVGKNGAILSFEAMKVKIEAILTIAITQTNIPVIRHLIKNYNGVINAILEDDDSKKEILSSLDILKNNAENKYWASHIEMMLGINANLSIESRGIASESLERHIVFAHLNDDVKVAEYYLSQQDENKRTKDLVVLAGLAAREGSLEIVKYCVKQDPSVLGDVAKKAALKGHLEIVMHLLANNEAAVKDIIFDNAVSGDQYKILYFLEKNDHIKREEIDKELKKSFKVENYKQYCDIQEIVTSSAIEEAKITDLLIQDDENKKLLSLILEAISKPNLGVMEHLCTEYGAEIAELLKHPKDNESISMALHKLSDEDQETNVVKIAAMLGLEVIVDDYLNNDNVFSAAHCAAQFGHIKCIEKCNKEELSQRNAMKHAANRAGAYGKLEVITKIEEMGWSIDYQTIANDASRNGHLNIVEHCFNKKRDINAQVVADYAANGGQVDILRWLREYHNGEISASNTLRRVDQQQHPEAGKYLKAWQNFERFKAASLLPAASAIATGVIGSGVAGAYLSTVCLAPMAAVTGVLLTIVVVGLLVNSSKLKAPKQQDALQGVISTNRSV